MYLFLFQFHALKEKRLENIISFRIKVQTDIGRKAVNYRSRFQYNSN
jgi:hypothetical protein